MTIRIGIVGASGYGGGELLRLALQHPDVEVAYATSSRYAGKRISAAHPNLRASALSFVPHDAALEATVDAVFLAGPHGTSAPRIGHYLKSAGRVFDLAADFRLGSLDSYVRHYPGWDHPAPEHVGHRAYGIPEIGHRDAIRSERLVSGAGCIATTSIMALWPLARRGLLERDRVVVDAKVGSSAAGASVNPGTHHPERAGVVRAYAPTGHRHQGEIEEQCGIPVHLSCHAVELVRGILATCHGFLTEPLTAKDIWRIYREDYGDEPFVRIVKERTGIYRYPEPKLCAGTNEFHVGFDVDERTGRIVILGALDNLVKGTAGAAIQTLNLAFGIPETTGLTGFALHP